MARRKTFNSFLLIIVFLLLSTTAYFYEKSIEFKREALSYRNKYLHCSGNAAVKVLNDQSYFLNLTHWLSKANKSIHIIIYEFKTYNEAGPPERPPDIVAGYLINKSEEGLDVKVILEGSVAPNKDTYNWLEKEGVNVKWDEKSKITHDKLIIIDGYIVIVGSHNFSYYAMTRNHEASLLLISKKVGEIEEEYFKQVWGSI